MEQNKKNLQKAIKKLADYLSRRSHFEKELRVKLSKHFSEEIIDRALQKAKENRWLETEEELSQKLLKNLNQKNKSWSYIKNSFFQKGLPLPAYNREKELAKAKKTAGQKFPNLKTLSHQEKIKFKQFLAYRGFEEDLMHELLGES